LNQKKKIKILFLINRLLPGGTENQLIWLAENLPRDRFEPVIGVLKTTDYQASLQIKSQTIDFKWSGPLLLKNISLVWKLRCYLVRERFDILQTHFVESEIHGALATRLTQSRTIYVGTRRNLYHWVDAEPWNFLFLRYTSRWADWILVNSHKVFKECQRKEGISSDKIRVIQNAIDLRRFNNIQCGEVKTKIGLSGKHPIVGVVGNWRSIKGLVPFLHAAEIVHREIQNSRFVLVGFGPQENELKSLAKKLGIIENIKFIHNSTKIPEIIKTFDIAVQPSLSESFSNVLIEYMAASKPIVATKVGDAERVIESGKNGLLVQPNNPQELATAILYICNDRRKAYTMGQLARKKVAANWSSDRILEKYQLFYKELVEDWRNKK